MKNLADMTWNELQHFIDQRIAEKLTEILPDIQKASSWQAVRESVAAHRWTPPLDAVSSRDLLREDRDR